MSNLNNRLSISKDIRKNFSSFYVFGDNSIVKKDLVGKNDLIYGAGSPSVFYGRNGRGEKFSGSSYLVNRSITPTVTGFPLFIFADVQDSGDPSLDAEVISLSPWLSGYLNQYLLYRNLTTGTVRASMTDGGLISYSNPSKVISPSVFTAALMMRSITNFTLFVNGEKLTPFQTLASGFSTKNSIVIGRMSNGSGTFQGGVFSAGWGTVDPGDDFLRRLTVNPTATIFQKKVTPKKSAITFQAKQRRSFSVLGTQAGKRQVQP